MKNAEKEFNPVALTKKQEVWKFFRFLFFSLSAGGIQVGVYTLFSEVCKIPNYWVAYLPALIMSVLWNFTINRKFNFKSVSNVQAAMLKILIYYSVFTPASTLWGDALSKTKVNMNADLWGYIILIGTMAVNFVTEFCVYRFWVYRKSINSSAAGKREQERVVKVK